MPALEISVKRPALCHVNLMLDTFIANATPEDLRSIIRNLLSTGPPGIAPAFTKAARSRLRQTNYQVDPILLFGKETLDSYAVPLPHLQDVLTRARSLFGAGMGFESIPPLLSIVRATIGLRWEEDGRTADFLSVIDSDITQAIQSCKEQIFASQVDDLASARATRNDLANALKESHTDVHSWGGEFCFDRSLLSVEYWKF